MIQSTTCLIAITTPRESDHFFSALLRLVDPETGTPLFNVLRIGNPCEECAETDTPWNCVHKLDERPPWKSNRKEKKYMPVYEGNMHLHKREQMGMDADTTSMVYKEEFIAKLEARPDFKIMKKPNVIWMAGDPAGGGKSEFGISAGFFQNGTFVVLYHLFIKKTFILLLIFSMHIYLLLPMVTRTSPNIVLNIPTSSYC